jgi:hypothetical protein
MKFMIVKPQAGLMPSVFDSAAHHDFWAKKWQPRGTVAMQGGDNTELFRHVSGAIKSKQPYVNLNSAKITATNARLNYLPPAFVK